MQKTEKFINKKLNKLRNNGGLVQLLSKEYKISNPVNLDTPSTALRGKVWAYNLDPNGVFETHFGTKLKLNGKDHPAINVGGNSLPAGAIVSDLGIQGDIVGMDTRGSFNVNNPKANSGIYFGENRVDQGEFNKISFCGLASAISVADNAEIDACNFCKLNTDGCCIGIYFAPRASYYTRISQCVFGDNPSYGIFADGNHTKNGCIHNLEISNNIFVRNCGANVNFTEEPSAIYLKNISKSTIKDNLIDCPGTYWHYDSDDKDNDARQIHTNKAIGLVVIGDENRILDNVFTNSSDKAIIVKGNNNVISGNLTDSDVVIDGENNIVQNLIFTSQTAKLILVGKATSTTKIFGVEEEKIIKG